MKRTKEKPRFPLMWVRWLDHFSDNTGWMTVPNGVDEYECLSVGFLLYEDKKHIVLAQTAGPNDRFVNTMSILKSTITEREELNRGIK